MLVDGRWTQDWQPVQAKDEQGRFVRQTSTFRNWVTPDGSPGLTGQGGFAAEPGRYHLVVALICPWASRTLIGRTLKGLEGAVDVSVVEPALTDQGWRFGDTPGATRDPLVGATYMHEIYTAADPHVNGRATVPVLWDKQRRTIVNNESSDILRMFTTGFAPLASDRYDLYPAGLRAEVDAMAERLYAPLNNGVYRAGFASSQYAYEEAFADVFRTLDDLEAHLEGREFLVGDGVTEADIRLFVTLVRFDAAYHGLFKCNLRRVADYPNLSRHVDTMLALPGVAATVDIGHIKAGYWSIKALNPGGIVPVGPELPFAGRLAAAGERAA